MFSAKKYKTAIIRLNDGSISIQDDTQSYDKRPNNGETIFTSIDQFLKQDEGLKEEKEVEHIFRPSENEIKSILSEYDLSDLDPESTVVNQKPNPTANPKDDEKELVEKIKIRYKNEAEVMIEATLKIVHSDETIYSLTLKGDEHYLSKVCDLIKSKYQNINSVLDIYEAIKKYELEKQDDSSTKERDPKKLKQ